MISMVLILLSRVVSLMGTLLLVYCVLTWFMPRTSKVMQVLSSLVDPLLTPIRGVLWRFTGAMGIDLSPLIAMLVLQLVSSLLVRLAYIL